MTRIPMTPEGFEKLKAELTHLKSVVRPQNIRDIEEARSHGDLSENAEYSAAKEKQGIIAAQLISIEDKISRAEIIDPKQITTKDKVVFGATVKLYDIDTEEELAYKIVGDDETDIKKGKIGISSPIAKGLIGKRCADEVAIVTPKGKRTLEITAIGYE